MAEVDIHCTSCLSRQGKSSCPMESTEEIQRSRLHCAITGYMIQSFDCNPPKPLHPGMEWFHLIQTRVFVVESRLARISSVSMTNYSVTSFLIYIEYYMNT